MSEAFLVSVEKILRETLWFGNLPVCEPCMTLFNVTGDVDYFIFSSCLKLPVGYGNKIKNIASRTTIRNVSWYVSARWQTESMFMSTDETFWGRNIFALAEDKTRLLLWYMHLIYSPTDYLLVLSPCGFCTQCLFVYTEHKDYLLLADVHSFLLRLPLSVFSPRNNDWPQRPAPLTQASLFRLKWPVPPLQVPEQAELPASSGWCHLNGTRVLLAITSCSLFAVLLLCWCELMVFCLWISGWFDALDALFFLLPVSLCRVFWYLWWSISTVFIYVAASN